MAGSGDSGAKGARGAAAKPRRPALPGWLAPIDGRRSLVWRMVGGLLGMLLLQAAVVGLVARSFIWPQYKATQAREACLDAARIQASAETDLRYLDRVAQDLVGKPWIATFLTGGVPQFRALMNDYASHQLQGVRATWFDGQGGILMVVDKTGADLPQPRLTQVSLAGAQGVVWTSYGPVLRVVRAVPDAAGTGALGWLQLSRPLDAGSTELLSDRLAVSFELMPASSAPASASAQEECGIVAEDRGQAVHFVALPRLAAMPGVVARTLAPQDVLAAGTRAALLASLALIATATGSIVVIGIAMHRRLVRPLQRLMHWCALLPELDRDTVAAPEQRRFDEIGQLARALDFTATTLLLQRDRLSAQAAELEEARDAATAGSHSRTMFLANMSHELRTPLNAIIGFSEVIRNATFGTDALPRYRDYAGDIHSSAEHLLAVIDMVLDLARNDVAKLTLYEEDVDLERAAALALRLVGPMAERAHVTLEAAPQGLPHLWLDAVRLRQMLLNLLANAVKFTKPGGRVRLVWQESADWLTLGVADTGIGIPVADRARVLQPFGRVEGSMQARHGGAGLGLPLTKVLTELHGGRLRLDSQPGVGTTVWLDFPRFRRLADPALPDLADTVAAE